MLLGILLGMILGVALAAGLAWYLLKSPSPFVNKDLNQPADLIKPDVVAPQPKQVQAAPAASAVGDSKPRFEFYKVLTDKPGADLQQQAGQPEGKPSPKSTYLQAGAFSNRADAENLKAILAMKGLEASVQTVKISGKGEMHRVRVGPFQSEQEMNSARSLLRQNGFEATQTH
jgi:cell division protein FtsN